jgi:hypothetical protein
MADIIAGISHPELIVGIAGPIGIDIEAITEAVSESFEAVGYRSVQIRITDEIQDIPSSARPPKRTDYDSVIRYKMKHATAICRKHNDQAYLMRIAIDAIQRERAAIVAEMIKGPGRKGRSRSTATPVPQRIVYVIRQIKRPQEVLTSRGLRPPIRPGLSVWLPRGSEERT